MVFFYTYSGKGEYVAASQAFTIADISQVSSPLVLLSLIYVHLFQHAFTILACFIALWRIRLLNYAHHDPHDSHHDIHANQVR